MPLEDLLPKSAIDELYENYKGSPADYITLRAELEVINSSILNRDANVFYESSDMTYAAISRKDRQYNSLPKRIVKDRFYGIVLYKTGDYNKEVYIDVPGKTSPLLNPDIFYTDPNLDLAKYREYLFEASSLDYFSTPVVGGLAVVKIPKNFPEHIYTNAEDAIYLHMKRPDILVAIKDSGETARPPLGGGSGGGMGAINSPTIPPGGDPTVPTDGSLPTVDSSTPDGSVAPVAGPYKKTDKFALPDGKTNAPLRPVDGNKQPQKVLGYWEMQAGTITVREISQKFCLKGDEGWHFLQIPAADKIEQLMAAYEFYVKKSLPTAERLQYAKKSNFFIEPKIISSFRSNKHQGDLYKKFKNKQGPPADPPGKSKHQYGLAIDFQGTGIMNSTKYQGSGPFYEWLKQNAPRYGFKRTVPREHWHWEFRYGWLNSSPGDFISSTRPLNP